MFLLLLRSYFFKLLGWKGGVCPEFHRAVRLVSFLKPLTGYMGASHIITLVCMAPLIKLRRLGQKVFPFRTEDHFEVVGIKGDVHTG